MLDILHEPHFVDLAPGEIYAILPDEGRFAYWAGLGVLSARLTQSTTQMS